MRVLWLQLCVYCERKAVDPKAGYCLACKRFQWLA